MTFLLCVSIPLCIINKLFSFFHLTRVRPISETPVWCWETGKKSVRNCEDRWIHSSALPEMWWLSRCPKLAGVKMLIWQQLLPTLALWLVKLPGCNNSRTWTLRMTIKSKVRDEDNKWLWLTNSYNQLKWIRFTISWTTRSTSFFFYNLLGTGLKDKVLPLPPSPTD